MIPSILARQLQKGLADYIKTTFPMTNPVFKGSLDEMLDSEDAVFREPYVAVRLPFRVAEEEADMLQAVQFKYKPWVHQLKAFQRLTGENGRSTVIATGTGSGKTECFFYPIMEYCYRHCGKPGIKALIIYPMNALAFDQVKRIAEEIYDNPELRGNITVGMYVGGFERNPSRVMSREQVITDRETMLSSPPDILVTNYKMLDYLLVRPKDAALWRKNGPETLKYIAVDELHTFDGAQGTDLACLLRRLKVRLATPPGHLCCIGTSATMGAKENAEKIRQYAIDVFGEPFDEEAVITEDRLSSSEFFAGHEPVDFTVPTAEQVEALVNCAKTGELTAYLELAARSWLDETFTFEQILADETRLALSERLMKHSFIQSLLEFMGDSYMQPSHLCKSLQKRYPELGKMKEPTAALDALFALISHARTGRVGALQPFLTVQVQVWVRELRRLVAKVSAEKPTYALANDLNDQQAKHYLPVVNCRDCGETGWVSLINERGNLTMTNLDVFYNLYFRCDEKVIMVFPSNHDTAPPGMQKAYLCTDCLQLNLGEKPVQKCLACGKGTIPVVCPTDNVYWDREGNKQYECPFCGSKGSLPIIGLRSATAISACISQLFASKFNDDKKTLTFSDNVQDAAHRAGFFNSRTWRFGLRSAIQQFALAEGDGLPLAAFSQQFLTYWRRRFTNEEFVSFFVAPNMMWMRAYEKMKAEHRLGPDQEAQKLLSDIEQRLSYEIMLEYGLHSRIGRTLEKSGCSTIGFDQKTIDEVAARVRERIVNELGVLYATDKIAFIRMVSGFLKLMAANGAVNDPVFNAYTRNDGQAFLLSNNNIKWLPGLQPSRRNTPRFLYEITGNRRRLSAFDLVSSPKYRNWIQSCVDEFILGEEVYHDLAKIILHELVKCGLVVAMPSSPGYSIWALNKDKVFISTQVKQFACAVCGTMVSVAAENAAVWEGAPCLRAKCGGRFYPSPDAQLDYYAKLYNSGDLVRVNAKEHTGLLARDYREELEKSFKRSKEDKLPWDPNLLSCTPTLEMGIDIGDLSTVVLCNIPPAAAQFIQRVGRAGRKDGNALTLVVANARPHDLYFYADPLEMIAGVIEPPKVFLNASAVLERQFIAYCLDCWVKQGVPEGVIPKHIGTCLNRLDTQAIDSFPYNFLHFIQGNLASLLRTFIQMFEPDLEESSIAELKRFVEGDNFDQSPIYIKILEAFTSLKEQREVVRNNIKQVKSLIKELESKPADSSYEEELKKLRSERAALSNVRLSIDRKNVFQFFTEEGLLPNYAFPEAGIILKAVLYRKGEQATDSSLSEKRRSYEKMIYEYSRSASSALSEFAPANNFYVDGRKLTIDQVDLTTAQMDKWRLCPNCAHAEREGSVRHIAACPKCGSPAWADAGQVRTMLKVQMVYSNTDYDRSLIGDDSEDRHSTFYCKQMLVDIDEDHDIVKAYRMDNEEFPFGYEFVKKATIREINFGESDLVGEKMMVAGTEEVRKGFKICKYCGKLQPEKGKPDHTSTCKAKRMPLESAEPYEEYLFLYREFTTEVLRLLVSATTLDPMKVRQESFIAAFMLGMKEYFGNVDHLRACLTDEPVEDAAYRKQYLVIYDSVPGGTGYLKQLLQEHHSLIDIFKKALSVLENCDCKKDKQKDGCYHCLYAYRQSRNIGSISRLTAIKLLKAILSGEDNLEEIPGLRTVPVNPIFESELERQFVEALEQVKDFEVTKVLLPNNKEGYRLKAGECRWDIEPQVVLDARCGVFVPTRADFVLWPVKATKGQKPIAVYTDGFMYHKDRVADDTLKREAVRRSKKFRVWVLSWKDIQNVFKAQGDYAIDVLNPERMPAGRRVYRTMVANGNAQAISPEKGNAFDLFAQYLQNKEAEHLFSVHANAYALSLLERVDIGNQAAFSDWRYQIQPVIDLLALRQTEFELTDTMFGKWVPGSSSTQLTILAGVRTSDLQRNKTAAEITVCALLNDKKEERTENYEAAWNGFWHFFNMMQFLPGFAAVSRVGMDNLVYSEIPVIEEEDVFLAEQKIVDQAWAEVINQLFDDEAKNYVLSLMKLGISPPSAVGFELVDARGAVVAECELAWENMRIALLLPEQMESKKEFINNGWKVLLPGDPVSVEMFQGGAAG